MRVNPSFKLGKVNVVSKVAFPKGNSHLVDPRERPLLTSDRSLFSERSIWFCNRPLYLNSVHFGPFFDVQLDKNFSSGEFHRINSTLKGIIATRCEAISILPKQLQSAISKWLWTIWAATNGWAVPVSGVWSVQ